MIYTNCGGWKISKMMLGTVQLGLDYGIANKSGKPTMEKAYEDNPSSSATSGRTVPMQSPRQPSSGTNNLGKIRYDSITTMKFEQTEQ